MRAEGEKIGTRYKILRNLQEGGMGTVYRAWDQQESRDVALKELRGEVDMATHLVKQKFAEESATLRLLTHPQIPRVFDTFVEGESEFISMQYIDGETLEQRTQQHLKQKGHALPPSQVIEYGVSVCGILRYLHELQPPVLHRDVKPANLIHRLGKGDLVLVDFGLARSFDGSTGATRTLAGTVGYAPLEQLHGQPEPRTDIYALGATLNYLLTGKHPRPLNVCSPRRLEPSVGPLLEAVVVKATQQSAKDRFASAADMEQALRQAQQEVAAPPAAEGKGLLHRIWPWRR